MLYDLTVGGISTRTQVEEIEDLDQAVSVALELWQEDEQAVPVQIWEDDHLLVTFHGGEDRA